MTINELHELTVNGDASAENYLFQKLSVSFRYFLQRKIDDMDIVEDLIQQTLVIIMRKYRQIEFTTSFSAWAYDILKKNTLDYYRTVGRHKDKLQQMAENRQMEEESNPALKIRLLECLRKLQKVNKRHARILNFHYQGFTVDEICAKLNITRNNVYILLSRARSLLKLCLQTGEVD